ncbi:jg1350 [Pararge aegeria aegeria]|uniref:Jg1350 protein n=1 Tax=Pararge aegeria aegeria TaxID=348720 RepID=A0A8S4S086_9NEOP|nr:jg1350 [Pararge aegeria aegeria]
MSYASMAFALSLCIKDIPDTPKRLNAQRHQVPFVCNVNIHKVLKLPTIAQYFQKLSKTYLEKSIGHPNPLIVAASFYSLYLSATDNKRMPKHILYYPDDQISTYH